MHDWPRLSDEQRQFFDDNGFLIIADALTPDMLGRLTDAADRVAERIRHEQAKGPHDKVDRRNVIVEDDVFLELLDWHRTVPLVYDIFGWNVGLITSHLIVLPPAAPGTEPTAMSNNFHRDGGTSSSEMAEPHPRLFLKIAYFLTDTTIPDSGAIQVIPGSNRLLGRPPSLNGNPQRTRTCRCAPF